MSLNVKSNVDLSNLDPEVKSYIYQSLVDFEPFSTPKTVVAVVAKDPTEQELKEKIWRISIALIEDDAKIEDEAADENIYTAIRLAKERLINQLTEIQDKVISNTERTVQIQSLYNKTNLH